MYSIIKRLKVWRIWSQGETGIGLVESLVAVALLGSVIAAMLSAMTTGAESVKLTDKRVTARSLAQAELEYIRSYPYAQGTESYPIISTPAEYTIELSVGTPPASVLSGTSTTFLGTELADSQQSVQMITVTVYQNDNEVYQLTTFKGNR